MLTMICRALMVAVLCVLFLLVSPTVPLAASQQDSERTLLSTSDIASRVTPSVVTLTTPTGTGSGVIVDASGVLITSLHVIQGDIDVEVKLSNGDVYDDVAVVDVDERRDLVLLKIKAFDLTAASLGNSDDVQVGEDVVLVGSPQGLDLTVSEGVISAVRDSGDGYRLLQTSAPASPGSSGGGMFNAYGELVGVVTSQITDGQNLNFGVPINYARGLLATEATMTLVELEEQVGGSDTVSSARVETGTATNAIDPVSVARLSEIVDASGLDFEQSSDGYWFTSFSGGTYLDQVAVAVYLASDTLVIVLGGVDGTTTELTALQLMSLLELNYDLSLAKVSFDTDGAIWPMAEAELRMLDGAGLALIADAVALATDEATGIVASSAAIPTEEAPDLTRSESAGGASLPLLQGHIEIHYDPSEWTEMTPLGPDVTNQYFHSSGELSVAVIAERVEIPGEAMLRVALENAEGAAPDVRATRRGSRLVNGVEVFFQEYQGTVEGISMTYLGHFYSDSNGTVQILAFTTSNLINVHRESIEQFVAGFVVEQ